MAIRPRKSLPEEGLPCPKLTRGNVEDSKITRKEAQGIGMEVFQAENLGNHGVELTLKEDSLPRIPLPTSEERNGKGHFSQVKSIKKRLQAIEENLENVKVVIQRTSASLQTEVCAMTRNKCNMLKEEILNLFSQTMHKVEDRFGTRIWHNYCMVEMCVASDRFKSTRPRSEREACVQMKAQLSG
ncbi:hypothetical protein Scep_025629 [Stephania cephalantha]|uniref:Uncharacterized protein n=1 Tax=Stephania cephalantha TaxID=152367 RepID=A0AAP0EL41_9MAGN